MRRPFPSILPRSKGFLLLAAVGAAVACNATLPGHQAQATTGLAIDFGADSCAVYSPIQMQAQLNYSSLRVYGIYVGGLTVNNSCPGSAPGYNATWVSQVTAQGWNLSAIYSGHQPSCVGSPHYPIDTNVGNAYNQGLSDGYDAVVQTYSRGMDGPITLDIDTSVPNGVSCAQATDYYIAGFIDEIRLNYSPSYRSGLYAFSNVINRAALFGNPPNQVTGINISSTTGVYNGLPAIPSSYFNMDQRIHQYSGPYTDPITGYIYDRDCFDVPVFGFTGHPANSGCYP